MTDDTDTARRKAIRSWLLELVDEVGASSPSDLATRAGLATSTVTRFLNQPVKYMISTRTLAKLSEYANKPLPKLTKSDSIQAAKNIPLVGYVGAGSQVYPIDDHERGFGMDTISAPPGDDLGYVAVVIDGDSQYPMYHHGDILYYHRSGDIGDQCLNRPCVVKVQDGATMVKILRRGHMPGTYNLESMNAPAIENQRIEWAAKIAWVRHK